MISYSMNVYSSFVIAMNVKQLKNAVNIYFFVYLQPLISTLFFRCCTYLRSTYLFFSSNEITYEMLTTAVTFNGLAIRLLVQPDEWGGV